MHYIKERCAKTLPSPERQRGGRWRGVSGRRDGWGSVGANVISLPAEIGDVRLAASEVVSQ